MKIKMQRFSSFAKEAKRLGVSEQIVRDYQAARKAWTDRVRWYAKKYGGIESGDIPKDIRGIRAYTGEDITDFLLSRIETIRSRTKYAARYLREKQQNYILNIITRAESSGADILTPDLLNRINNMSSRELGSIIDSIGTTILETYYELSGDGDEQEADEYLLSQIQRVL